MSGWCLASSAALADEGLFYLAVVTLLVCAVLVLPAFFGNRTMRNLRDVPPLESPLPKVSVIVAARNEQRDIGPALQSLLELDYPNMELTVVDDRSTDRTGEILDCMAERHPRLRVVHITTLPAGWLGKNHALDCGARDVDSQFILFTDADVVMQPSTLRRAVGYMQAEKLDHLPMLFELRMPNWFLESFVLTFTLYFWAWFRPWKAKDPRSGAYVGAGGFNLFRTEAYLAIGCYRAIRMRPDDDVKLGKLIKKHGFRQEMLLAPDHVSVPWYASLRELVRGLEKNAFSAVDYRSSVIVASSLLVLLFNVFPFLAVWLTTGPTRWVYAAAIAVLMAGCLGAAYHGRLRFSCSLGFPVAALLLVFIQWRTMVITLARGRIRWRDTCYRLEELKANKV